MLDNFKAYQLAKSVFHRAKKLRVARYHQDQLQRAASSIVLNLAEGSGRPTHRDQMRFYGMAYGSLREVRAIFELEEIHDKTLLADMNHLGAMLFKLCQNRRRKVEKETPTDDTDSEH